MQKAKQKPDVKIGLVAYRDRGDAYVTQVLPLTNDLDKVYETLMAYRADGGGDGPEDVNAALNAALTHMQWSDGKDTLKMIFLVGDAPPHMDYADTVAWSKTARDAVRKNIYVNTIQCGNDSETTKTWKDIAHAAEGRYAMIAQDGGAAVAVATPFDAEIGKLAAELDSTYMSYGADAKEADATRARASSMAAAAEAPGAVLVQRPGHPDRLAGRHRRVRGGVPFGRTRHRLAYEQVDVRGEQLGLFAIERLNLLDRADQIGPVAAAQRW